MTIARWSIPRRIAGCSTPMPASSDDAEKVARLLGCAAHAPRTPSKAIASRSRGRSARPIICGMPSAELTKLAPEEGEETALAERRTAMMQAEKIAGDLQDAYDDPSPATPRRLLVSRRPFGGWSAARRWRRRSPILPSRRWIRRSNAIEDARVHLEAALRAADYDPTRTRADRGAAVRVAGGRTQIQHAGRSPRPCWPRNIRAILR